MEKDEGHCDILYYTVVTDARAKCECYTVVTDACDTLALMEKMKKE